MPPPAASSRAMPCCSRASRRPCRSADEGSLFQRVFSSMNGIDPYAAAVSDVYQDLFGEGSYAGKGIYEVDAFEAALAGRVPEFDPAQPRSVRRRLRPRRPRLRRRGRRGIPRPLRRRRAAPPPLGARRLAVAALDPRLGARLGSRRRSRGAMPAIGRWKMLDNLRRTCPRRPACWRCWRAGRCRSTPRWCGRSSSWRRSLLPSLSPVARRHRAAPRRDHARAAIFARVGADLRLALAADRRSIVTFLAHQAWLMGDAIVRTLFRLFVTRRNLLRMDPGGAGDDRSAARSPRLLSRGWPARSSSASWRWRCPGCSGDRTWPLAAPFAAALDRLARDRALGQPASARSPAACRHRRRTRARCG